MNKAIVTGGAGFLGSNLIKCLIEKYPNIDILSLDNYSSGKKENHIHSPNVKYKVFNTKDINKRLEIEDFGAEVLFHFGEFSKIKKSFDKSEQVMHTNLNGTSQVLEFCKKNKVKLVYLASISEFINNGQDENVSPYSWSKAKMVELIKNYHNWFGLQYEICHLTNIYESGQIVDDIISGIACVDENLSLSREWTL